MAPQPYPHRVSFLAPAMTLPRELEHLGLLPAKLLAAWAFDHLVRHPVVAVADFDDGRLTDDADRLVDARHPSAEEVIDGAFRLARRHEVLWFELSLDPARPHPVRLRARRPAGAPGVSDAWTAPPGPLGAQLAGLLDAWLVARRLAPAGAPAPAFTTYDLVAATVALDRALVAARPAPGAGDTTPTLPDHLLAPPPRLEVPYLRALSVLTAVDAGWDERILAIDPAHPVARARRALAEGVDDELAAVVTDAPMLARAHAALAAGGVPDDVALRHHGIAASLAPDDPWACIGYGAALEAAYRREEAYRWYDRATIAAPACDRAHVDCVRVLRLLQRPGQAHAEAQFRCGDVLQRWRDGDTDPAGWVDVVHAGLVHAQVHLDAGRLDDAIALAGDALARIPPDAPDGVEFAGAIRRLRAWKADPRPLAHVWARDGHHRGEPGRVLDGLARAGVADHDDVAMQLDALIAIGREDLALIAFAVAEGVDGVGIVGDGKARLAGARAHLLRGDVHAALDNLQIVQLRRPQSRFEAELERLWRLAACRPAAAWEGAIARRLDAGARTLARHAARDLADFVPGLDGPATRRALGERRPWTVEPGWLVAFAARLPRLGAGGPAIDHRLAPPADATLAAADVLAQEWWTVLPPAGRDRDAHAAAALYALGVALARYLALTSGPPTPIAGAYRHVATEALHLVRRARYQLDDDPIRGLLELVERCAAHAEEWLVDRWLRRIEHALDLDVEQGAYLPALVDGLPRVTDLLRGDERIGWELRLADDLVAVGAADAAAVLYERGARTVETGAAALARSRLVGGAPPADALDAHWTAALANPTNHGEPWRDLAAALFAAGRPEDAFDAMCRALPPSGRDWRRAAVASVADAWRASRLDVPLSFDEAHAEGLAAYGDGDLPRAARCLRWCAAWAPEDAKVASQLGTVLAAQGDVAGAVRAFAACDRHDAARHAGAALSQAGHHAAAVRALRAAAWRFQSVDDWRLLAAAAWYASDDATAAWAYQAVLDAGAPADAATLGALARALYRTGQWAACEAVARRLLDVAGGDAAARAVGLHAMARALAGQGQWGDALRIATEAQATDPVAEHAAELAGTVRLCQAREAPPYEAGPETSRERYAFDSLAAGDLAAVHAILGAGPTSWGLERARLAAAQHRGDGPAPGGVAPRAVEAALAVLDRTAGTTDRDAAACRLRALRIREDAFLQIDAPPPLGAPMTRAQFEAEWARRLGHERL